MKYENDWRPWKWDKCEWQQLVFGGGLVGVGLIMANISGKDGAWWLLIMGVGFAIIGLAAMGHFMVEHVKHLNE